MPGLVHLIFPLVFLYVGLVIIIGAKKGKAADSTRIVGNFIAALLVMVVGPLLLVRLPGVVSLLVGTPDKGPTRSPHAQPTLGDIERQVHEFLRSVMVWIRHERPVFVAIAITCFTISIFCLAVMKGTPHAQRAIARWEARRAFVHLHNGPLVAPTRERLAGLWGPRPDEMTRCVECGRNEWPACRCALMREGYAMTSEPPAPEVPLGQFTLPPWGTPDGRPLVLLNPGATPGKFVWVDRRVRELAGGVHQWCRSRR